MKTHSSLVRDQISESAENNILDMEQWGSVI